MNVISLCNRVSQRMLRHTPHTPEELAIIKLLLENCIKLLKEDINSQVYKKCMYAIIHTVILYIDTLLYCM